MYLYLRLLCLHFHYHKERRFGPLLHFTSLLSGGIFAPVTLLGIHSLLHRLFILEDKEFFGCLSPRRTYFFRPWICQIFWWSGGWVTLV